MAISVAAQNTPPKTDTLIYYFRAGNEMVNTMDSAEYIRLVYPDAEQPQLFVIREMYKNGKPKLSAKALDKELKPRFDGNYIEFYDNGKRKCQMFFVKGQLKGKAYTYFQEGRLYAVVDNYFDDANRPAQKLEECYDADGKQICQKGDGLWIEYDGDLKTIDISGNVNNGHKIGEWNGYLQDSLKYVETYSGGIMKTWQIFDKQDNKVEYTEVPLADSSTYRGAGYAGGSRALYKFLAEQIRYPRAAIQTRTSGTVFVNFTISANGELSNFRIVKGIKNGCNDEAVRVVKLSSPWIPAYRNGKAIASTFTMPIAFNIGRTMQPVDFSKGKSDK